MKIAKQIKQHLDTISGKRRLTILNSYIKDHFKEPTNELRTVSGEYSPKMIAEQLSYLITYLKGLCSNNGKSLGRYYSFTRIKEIEKAIGSLASEFENISDSTRQTTLRNLLNTSANSLEVLKQLLGPFTDLRFDSAIENLTSELSTHQAAILEIETISKDASKYATTIQKNLDKSEKSSQTFDGLIKEVQSLKKQLDAQELINKEINDRARMISKNITKMQVEFEERLESITTYEKDMLDMRNRIQDEYNLTIDKAREFEGVAVRVESIETQTKNIINQAQHALNVSQGAGFLDSYKDLYRNAARLREFFPWFMGAVVSFMACVYLITLITLTVTGQPNVGFIFKSPRLWAEISIIPIALFCFFFCMIHLKQKSKIKKRYQTRYAALETYLKLSEHLPYNSPEQVRTVSHIMRFLEEDFNPIAVKGMFQANNQFNNSLPVNS